MSVHSAYSEISLGVPKQHLDAQSSEYETRISYHNQTGRPIRVTHRNGLNYILQSEAVVGVRSFIVRVELIMSQNVRDQIIHLLNSVGQYCDKHLYFMKLMIEEHGIRQLGNRYYLNLEYRTRLEDITHRGLYVSDSDILLSDGSREGEFVHPFSEQGLLLRAEREQRLKTQGLSSEAFHMSFKLVDTSQYAGNRYYRIGPNIMELIPTPSTETQQDGLYVYFHRTGDTHWVSLDDTENLRRYGIFNTRAEAECADAELVDLEIKRLKQELEREQYLNKQSLLKLEREHEELKLNNASRKEDMKDYYEERSYQRRDENEMMKALPAIIVGLGGVFMAIKAFK